MLFFKLDQLRLAVAAASVIAALGAFSPAMAESGAETGFASTWKLLNTQDKQQFISGYLRGWKDAQQVTEVAITYVEQNPKNAVDGLKSLKGLYEVSSLSPDYLAREIDAFFKNPENANATLSAAITAAKASQSR